jgi:hypothetical protein
VQDEVADFLAEHRLARLSGRHDLATFRLQRSPQPVDLGRLAGAVHPLEGHEHRA